MLTNCPNCGAPIFVKFVACPYCDTPYDVAGTREGLQIQLDTNQLKWKIKQWELNSAVIKAMRERRKSILYADDRPMVTIETLVDTGVTTEEAAENIARLQRCKI